MSTNQSRKSFHHSHRNQRLGSIKVLQIPGGSGLEGEKPGGRAAGVSPGRGRPAGACLVPRLTKQPDGTGVSALPWRICVKLSRGCEGVRSFGVRKVWV